MSEREREREIEMSVMRAKVKMRNCKVMLERMKKNKRG